MSDPKTEKLFRKAVSAVKAKKGRGLVFGASTRNMTRIDRQPPTEYPLAVARSMAKELSSGEDEGWTYTAVSSGKSGKAYVEVRDEKGVFLSHWSEPKSSAKKGRVLGSSLPASDEKRLTIKTDNKWHGFKYRNEVPAKVLKDQFDYQDEDISDNFFKFKGTWYHTDQFMRLDDRNGEMKGWDGYAGDSYFSGVLIKLSSDGERYKVATYYS